MTSNTLSKISNDQSRTEGFARFFGPFTFNTEERNSECVPQEAEEIPRSVNSSDLLRNIDLDNAFRGVCNSGESYPDHFLTNCTPVITGEGNTTPEEIARPNLEVEVSGNESDTRYSLDDYKCPICLDTFINTVKVDCSYGHKFCNFCITSWISISRHLVTECPVCRGAIFGKTLDLKMDAEIRTLFEQMPESEKKARLVSIKERLQMECPPVYFAEFAAALPPGFLQNSHYMNENSETAADQYSYEHNNYYQQQYHHPINHYHFQFPPVANHQEQEYSVDRNLANNHDSQTFQHNGSGLHQEASQDFTGVNDFTQPQQNLSTAQIRETSRLPMWMAPHSSSGTEANPPGEPTYTATATEENGLEHGDGAYQHFRYQNQQSSLWNNNLYLTAEDNNRGLNETPVWNANGMPNGHIPATSGAHHPQIPGSGSEANFRNYTFNGPHGHRAGEANQYHSTEQSNSFPQNRSSMYASTTAHRQNSPPAQQQRTEHWQYPHQLSHFTPVLFPCPPVMPAPVHYPAACTFARCYFSSCPIHNPTTSQQFSSGLIHLNCSHNFYPQMEPQSFVQNGNCAAPRMRPNMPGRNSIPIQLPTPNVPVSSQRPHTFSSLPSSPTAGSPRSQANEDDRRRRRHHRNGSTNFGDLSPRAYSYSNDTDYSGRNPSRVASCPVLSHGSQFSGGFSLFSRGYVGFQISHLPAYDRRIVAPPGRITHPLVSLLPLTPDGTSSRVTLTFDVHRA